MKRLSLVVAGAVGFSLSACAPPGYEYDVGNFTHPHPSAGLCASLGQELDMNTKQCVTPFPRPPPVAQTAQAPVLAEAPTDITASLSAEQREAIGDRVRQCWTRDAGAPGIDTMQVMLTVTVDPADGTARSAEVADQDRARIAGDLRLRAFAERAVRAFLDPRCDKNLVPKDKLVGIGTPIMLTFRFSDRSTREAAASVLTTPSPPPVALTAQAPAAPVGTTPMATNREGATAATAAALEKAEAYMGHDNGAAYGILLGLANQGIARAETDLGTMFLGGYGMPKTTLRQSSCFAGPLIKAISAANSTSGACTKMARACRRIISRR